MGIMSYRRCLDTNIFWVMGVDDILGGGFEGHIHTWKVIVQAMGKNWCIGGSVQEITRY